MDSQGFSLLEIIIALALISLSLLELVPQQNLAVQTSKELSLALDSSLDENEG